MQAHAFTTGQDIFFRFDHTYANNPVGGSTFTITVTAVNHPPAASSDSYSTNQGTPLLIAAPGVLGNDTDADGNALTAIVVASPTHGALTLSADGSFNYTPAAGFSGADSFTYKANDGTADSNSATVTITVISVGVPPTITSLNNTAFTVGTAGSFTVTATGTPTPALSESGALPTGVSFNPSTHTLFGTPAGGTGRAYTITFTATSSVATVNQTFTLVVNEAPAITSANAATFTVGTGGTFTVVASGFPLPSISQTGAAGRRFVQWRSTERHARIRNRWYLQH